MSIKPVVDFGKNVVVFKPATKPRDRRLKLFVGASLPNNSQVESDAIKRLQGKYGGRLLIVQTEDGRVCMNLPCRTARSLEEAGKRADRLKRNVAHYLGVTPLMLQCGYGIVCEQLGMPNYQQVLRVVS